jgi:hypothetical protein
MIENGKSLYARKAMGLTDIFELGLILHVFEHGAAPRAQPLEGADIKLQ